MPTPLTSPYVLCCVCVHHSARNALQSAGWRGYQHHMAAGSTGPVCGKASPAPHTHLSQHFHCHDRRACRAPHALPVLPPALASQAAKQLRAAGTMRALSLTCVLLAVVATQYLCAAQHEQLQQKKQQALNNPAAAAAGACVCCCGCVPRAALCCAACSAGRCSVALQVQHVCAAAAARLAMCGPSAAQTNSSSTHAAGRRGS
jgi:hypothetical protein